MNEVNRPTDEQAACDDWTKISMHCKQCGAQFFRKVKFQRYCDEHRHLDGTVIRPTELESTDPNPLSAENRYFRRCLKGHVDYSASFDECPSCKVERNRTADLRLNDMEQLQLYEYCRSDPDMYSLVRRLAVHGLAKDLHYHDDQPTSETSITLVDPMPCMLNALREALPIIEAHTPRLSTSGTMVRVRELVRDAIRAAESFEWAKRTLEVERTAPAGPRDGLSKKSDSQSSKERLCKCPYCESLFKLDGSTPEGGSALDIALNELERVTVLWREAHEKAELLGASPETKRRTPYSLQLETALGQWLHDHGSNNELSQRSRILLGQPAVIATGGTKIPHTPEELAVLRRFAVEALAPEDRQSEKANEPHVCHFTGPEGFCRCGKNSLVEDARVTAKSASVSPIDMSEGEVQHALAAQKASEQRSYCVECGADRIDKMSATKANAGIPELRAALYECLNDMGSTAAGRPSGATQSIVDRLYYLLNGTHDPDGQPEKSKACKCKFVSTPTSIGATIYPNCAVHGQPLFGSAPNKTDAKQDCVCKDYCEREGRQFTEHWEWRCKGLPVPRPARQFRTSEGWCTVCGLGKHYPDGAPQFPHAPFCTAQSET